MLAMPFKNTGGSPARPIRASGRPPRARSAPPGYDAAVDRLMEPPIEAPRLTVAITFDSDAMSDGIRRGDSPVKLSHGEFGPRVAVPRILEVLEREAIGATWFIPGHTLTTFPDSTAAVVSRGHEIACHGWYH